MSLIHRIGRSWVQFLITVSTMLPVPSWLYENHKTSEEQ
jgi:hypothetical protein